MAVQPPDALQQQIHRAQIGQQQVKIDVKRLLEYLCAHDDQPIALRRSRVLAHPLEQMRFPLDAVGHDKLRMEIDHLHFRQLPPQQLRQLLRTLDGVDNDARAAACI